MPAPARCAGTPIGADLPPKSVPQVRSAAALLAVVCTAALAQTPPPAQNSLRPAATDPQIALPTAPPTAPSGVTQIGPLSSYQGMRVASVELRSAVPLPKARFDDLVAQKPDQPLDRNKVRQSIVALYETGRFADVEVQAERTQRNEITLVFVARENYFVGTLDIAGAPRPPSAEQLLTASKLQLGELFEQEKLQAALDRMKHTLTDNGYYQATVTADTSPHRDTQQIDIHFHVNRGLLARVGAITVQGVSGFTQQEVESIAHLHPNDKVSVKSTNKALERLRKKYNRQNRLEAQVAIAGRQYHAETNRLDYTLQLVRGPSIDVKVEGAKISIRKLKKYVPIYEESAVDDDLLNEGRRNLRDYYQTKGYFDVTVGFREEYDAQQDRRHIEYAINLGDKHKLEAVKFEWKVSPASPLAPAPSFDEGALRERMLIQPAGTLLRQGRYSESILVRDKESIENVYKANGFQHVSVQSKVQDDYQGRRGHMFVTFLIDEQAPTVVQDVQVIGNKSVTRDVLDEHTNTKPSQFFSDFNLGNDRDAIMNYYFNAGFPDAKVESQATPANADGTKMNVQFKIDEGQQQFVDRVLITGLQKTRPHIARREFQLWNGDPLSQTNQLDTQRRLYDLGIFNEVDMAVQNPEGKAESKNLLVHFDEARRWTFNYGFGLEAQIGGGIDPCPGDPASAQVIRCKQFRKNAEKEGVSPRISLDVTRLNFRGRDQTLVFKGHYGRLQKRGLVSFESPRWFDFENLKFTVTSFYDNSSDVRTFTAQRLEGSAQIEQAIGRITTLLYRYSYRRVQVDQNTLAISPELIPLLSQPVRVGMPSFTYIRDKRDNALDTKRGNYTTADFGLAAGFFGSESDFGRVLVQNNSYFPFKLGQARKTKDEWVFARATRLGIEELFGKSTLIPLPERFFQGGNNSHRGFELNQAGPRDPTTGAPLGGGAVFFNSVELRTPAISAPFVGENLSFVLFEDAGNVFNAPADIFHSLLQVTQPHKDDCRQAAFNSVNNTNFKCNFNYLSHAVGAGIRYKTPIGPVRLDFSYNLNPPIYSLNDPVSNLHLVKQASHFNFFISIGQSF